MSDYLPPEVVTEILVKLPVKSLLRFRTVCREWLYIITNPTFIAKHLSFSRSQSSKTLVSHYSKTLRQKIFTIYENNSFSIENSTRISFPISSFPKLGYYHRMVGCCNGLVCLSNDFFISNETIVLWNPSIKRVLTLPSPRTLSIVFRSYTFALGFGYDAKNDDYKVVRIAYLSPGPPVTQLYHKVPPEVEVFSLSTGAWKRVKNSVECYITDHLRSQVCIDGMVHWPAYKKTKKNAYGKPFHNVVLKFDLNSEEFVEWSLPKDLACEHPARVFVTSVKNNLCVLSTGIFSKEVFLDFSAGSISIWAMTEYGDMESWVREYGDISDETGLLMMLGFTRDYELVFSGESGELLVYNFGNKKIRGTGIRGTTYSFFFDKYEESLVLLGKGKEVQETEPKPEPDNEDEDEIFKRTEFDSILISCRFISSWIRDSDA